MVKIAILSLTRKKKLTLESVPDHFLLERVARILSTM